MVTTGGMSTQGGRSVLVTPGGREVGSASISTIPSGRGGRRREEGPSQEELERRRREEERRRFEEQRRQELLAQARAEKQSKIRAGRIGGQLKNLQPSSFLPGATRLQSSASRPTPPGFDISTGRGGVRQPTAGESLAQMSIDEAQPFETREAFIRRRAEERALAQVRRFESLSPQELRQEALSGNQIVGMSTPEGESFNLRLDQQSLRSSAEQDFSNLPLRERTRLRTTGALVDFGQRALTGLDALPLTRTLSDTGERGIGKTLLMGPSLSGGSDRTSNGKTNFEKRLRATPTGTEGQLILSPTPFLNPAVPLQRTFTARPSSFVANVDEVVVRGNRVTFTRGVGEGVGDIPTTFTSVQVSRAGATGSRGVASVTTPSVEFSLLGRPTIRTTTEVVSTSSRAQPGSVSLTAAGQALPSPRGLDIRRSVDVRGRGSITETRQLAVIEDSLSGGGRQISITRGSGASQTGFGLGGERALVSQEGSIGGRSVRQERFDVFGQSGRDFGSADVLFQGAGRRTIITPSDSTGTRFVGGRGPRGGRPSTTQTSNVLTSPQSPIVVPRSTTSQVGATTVRRFPTIVGGEGSQGAFAGQGLFERTELQSFGSRQQTSFVPLSNQIPRTDPFSSVSLPRQRFPSNRARGRVSSISLSSNAQLPISGVSPITGQALRTPEITRQELDLLSQLERPGTPVPFTSFTPFNIPRGNDLFLPPRLPSFSDSSFGGTKTKGRREVGLTPSFTAISLGITGETTFESGSPFLGLDIRPVPVSNPRRSKKKTSRKRSIRKEPSLF